MNRLVGYIKGMDLDGFQYLEPVTWQTISLADTEYGNFKERDLCLM